MIVKPGMPLVQGTTDGSSGELSTLADIVAHDRIGIKVQAEQSLLHPGVFVRVTVDSLRYPCTTVTVDPDDAEYLGNLLIAKAAEARRQS